MLAGSWFEFGVWEGATLNGVAEYRRVNCDGQKGPNNKVYGFDTFTGLPEAWGEFRPSVSVSTPIQHVTFLLLRRLQDGDITLHLKVPCITYSLQPCIVP